MDVFKLKQFSYYYPGNTTPALREVGLEVREGEFLLLMGRSGSGKSTLARVLSGLIPDFYGGDIGGEVLYRDVSLAKWPRNELAREIGIVFQEPDKQLLFHNVERDIAFGLENLGIGNKMMRQRVAEMMDFLGINGLRQRDTRCLSGGEKQKIALAGALAANPRVLILDEPTSQLDPAAATEFLTLTRELNHEFGVTVIMIEQRLERAFAMADRVIVMDGGAVKFQGETGQQPGWALRENYPLLPVIPGIFAQAGLMKWEELPMTVKAGRKLLNAIKGEIAPAPESETINNRPSGQSVLEASHLSFAYDKGESVLNDVSFEVWPGEFIALIGPNGAGKSTLLQLWAGLLDGYRGAIRVGELSGKRLKPEALAQQVAYLPQDLDDFFLADTVRQDILLAAEAEEVDYWLEVMELEQYSERDPRKLSCGEKQRVALATVLAANPAIILLDEPTTGIDQEQKRKLGQLLQGLCQEGKAIVTVTHDMDFISEYAARTIFLHDGCLLAQGPVGEQINSSIFYTSQVARLFRPIDAGVINEAQARGYLSRFW